MAEAEAAAPAAVGSSGGGGGGSKIVMILAIVNTVVCLGMAAVLFISFQKDSKKAKVEDIAPDAGAHGEKGADGAHGTPGAAKKEAFKMITLDQFTVNLSTPGSVTPKFMRVNIALQVATDDSESEVGQKMPQVRNAIIDLINSKRASDLANTEGREYLKEEIKNALNSFMVSGKIQGVFFTNFALTS